jgi:hypothetical protein
MRKWALFVFLSFALIVTGCEVSPGRLNQPANGGNSGSITPFNGNFSFAATSQVTSTVFIVGGSLKAEATGAVTATMHVADSTCFNSQTDVVPFTGTITSAGAFTATSSAVNNQIIHFTATITPDGSTISGGTFTITGGCATGEHGTLSGFEVASMTATSYTGSFVSGSNTITVSSSPLTQGTTANPQGQFPLTGTLAFSTSTCGLSSATVQTGTVAGVIVNLVLNGSDGLSIINFSGQATDQTTKTINGVFAISGTGVCGGATGNASLTHP